jgi:hemerythrin-like metal-binding protein
MAAEWTPDLTLNHHELDADHVDLFRKLRAAEAALAGSRDALAEAMELLSEAFLAHVAHEDALMSGSGYPEREGHRAAHDFFLAALARLRAALAQRAPTADEAEWLRSRAPEWLRFHVRVNDAPLVAWLARRRERAGPAEDVARRRS